MYLQKQMSGHKPRPYYVMTLCLMLVRSVFFVFLLVYFVAWCLSLDAFIGFPSSFQLVFCVFFFIVLYLLSFYTALLTPLNMPPFPVFYSLFLCFLFFSHLKLSMLSCLFIFFAVSIILTCPICSVLLCFVLFFCALFC